MDLEALRAASLAAREFTHDVGDCSYRLRVPTRHDVLLTSCRLQAPLAGADAAAVMLLQRGLLEAAIVGWQGVRVRHLLPGHAEGDAPLPWEAGAVPELLDARPDHEQALSDALSAAMAARRAAIEADAKTSRACLAPGPQR